MLRLKIVFAEFYIVLIHRKGIFFEKFVESLVIKAAESVKRFDRRRCIVFGGKGIKGAEGCFTRLNRVYDMSFYCVQFAAA